MVKSEYIGYVKCCEGSKKYGIVFHHTMNQFYLSRHDAPIEYCPWCRVLLDTNLVEE